MFQMIRGLGPTQRNYLIRGDETWIFWNNDHGEMRAQFREDVSANAKKMISSQKTTLSACFSRIGFVSIEFLVQWQNYNSHFVTKTILPSLVASLFVRGPKLKTTAAHLHTDNAKPHNSRLCVRKTEEYGFMGVPRPPYSLDLAPCDFFLFSYLRSQLEGKILFDEDDVKREVRRIFTEIPVIPFHSVISESARRLEWCIQVVGEYVS
jgi:hypothetical protein